ncbi:MAG: hypothetical protein ACJ768_08370, partial [Gaiellaceae bacterium]
GQPTGEPQVPGRPMGYLAPPGADPEADVTSWVGRTDAGEPYTDPTAQQVVDTLERYHSSYYIDHSEPPAPLFIASGFTDDLFPVVEALRFANRTRREYPDAPVSLMFGDFGHQRAANKPADRARLVAAIRAWMDHWLRGGPPPARGVTATTQTCPHTDASDGPFTAPTFAQLAHAAVHFASSTPQTILSSGGNPAVGRAIDPITGGGDDCGTTSADDEPGTATYRLPSAPASGYTLLGAPTISAKLTSSGQPGMTQIAGRLWDVAPDGSSQTLVARGLYRPTGGGTDTWQLNANGWRFAPGHVAKLELLGSDPPFARPSNEPFQVGVNQLDLRLPVR